MDTIWGGGNFQPKKIFLKKEKKPRIPLGESGAAFRDGSTLYVGKGPHEPRRRAGDVAAALKLIVVDGNHGVIGLVEALGINLRQGGAQLLAQGRRHHEGVLGGGAVKLVVEHVRLKGPEVAVEKVLGEGGDLLAVLVLHETVLGVGRQGFPALKAAKPDGNNAGFFHGDSPLS